MRKWLFVLAMLALIGSSMPSLGAGFIIVDDTYWRPGPIPPHPISPPWPPRPFPEHRYVFAPIEIQSVKVNTRITDQVAVTSVEQQFYNPNPSRLEGTFVFPIPKGAHLDKFSMEIDGKQVEAELLKADKARGIYEDIVRRLKDPALLEYAGRDMLKVRIFPFDPNGRKRINLKYTQLLKADDGLIGYTLPVNTQKYSAKPVGDVSVKVELETKRPLKSIYSPSHAVEVKRQGPRSATAGYEAKDTQQDSDFALYFAPEQEEIGVNLLTYKTGGEDGFFVLLAAPGIDIKEKQIVMKDVAFVLDTSGSMAGKKLEQAKKALQFCIENLNDGDRFEIIRFSTEVEPLFDKLVDASTQNREKAENFIKDLKPTGATAIDEALRKALELRPSGGDRPFVVIFLTDGRPTIGTTDEDEIVAGVKKRGEGRTRIFCFGIGTDVNTHLLDRITEETRAFSQYVLPEEDLEVKVSSFFSKIKEPVLTNPTLRFTGGIRATKLYPNPLPDLFKGEQLVLAGRYSGSGDSAVVIEGTVNGVNKKFSYDLRFPDENNENEFIPRLWATRRVGYVLDEIRLHGENPELRDEATELARKYGIVTPYTAYLITEDEARRDVSMSQRSLQDFGKDDAVRKEAAQNWYRFKTEQLGDAAVAGARHSERLKSADSLMSATVGGEIEAKRALGLTMQPNGSAPAAQDSKLRLMHYSQQTRFVAGKNFFRNNNQWTDSEIQKHPDARHVRVQFGSKEYFELVAKYPNAPQWMALGQNMQLAIDGVIYEITSE